MFSYSVYSMDSSWSSWLNKGKELASAASEHTIALAQQTKTVMKDYSPVRDFVDSPEVLSMNMQITDISTVPMSQSFSGLMVGGPAALSTTSSLFSSNSIYILVTNTQIARIEPSTLMRGGGTVRELYNLRELDSLKFKRTTPGLLKLTFKAGISYDTTKSTNDMSSSNNLQSSPAPGAAPLHTLHALLDKPMDCVAYIKTQMAENLGVQGVHTHKPKQNSISPSTEYQNTDDFLKHIYQLIGSFEGTPSFELVKTITEKFKIATERLSAGNANGSTKQTDNNAGDAGDQVAKSTQDEDKYMQCIQDLRNFLQRSDVTKLLESESNARISTRKAAMNIMQQQEKQQQMTSFVIDDEEDDNDRETSSIQGIAEVRDVKAHETQSTIIDTKSISSNKNIVDPLIDMGVLDLPVPPDAHVELEVRPNQPEVYDTSHSLPTTTSDIEANVDTPDMKDAQDTGVSLISSTVAPQDGHIIIADVQKPVQASFTSEKVENANEKATLENSTNDITAEFESLLNSFDTTPSKTNITENKHPPGCSPESANRTLKASPTDDDEFDLDDFDKLMEQYR